MVDVIMNIMEAYILYFSTSLLLCLGFFIIFVVFFQAHDFLSMKYGCKLLVPIGLKIMVHQYLSDAISPEDDGLMFFLI